MKKFKNSFFALAFLTVAAAFFATLCASCYSPSPLYGAWSDNAGNKISFSDDGSFSATIIDSNNDKKTYSGTFSVIENVISFSKSDGSINSEWDLRGGILYLTWTDSYGTLINLSLYHTA